MAAGAVLSLSGVFGVSPQVVALASQPAPAAPASSSGNASITPGQSNAELERYWTPERRASARDLDRVEVRDGGGGAAVDTPPGEPVSVPGPTGSLPAAP